jgi:hypothetical protein
VLNVDDLHKQVTQLNKGEEYEPLLTLANSVIEMCDEPSQTGTTAASLAIGLSKLRDLELAPETLALIYSDKPARASAGGEGFLLRLDGLDAVTRRYDSTGTIGGNIALRLGDDDIVGLINTLSEKNLDDLPANLYSDRNTSLTVRVLEYRKSIHARNFAGQNNETHGDAQKDFDTIAAALATLHRKILAEGQSTGN